MRSAFPTSTLHTLRMGLALLALACLAILSLAAAKLPSRHDEWKHSFIPSGESYYEYNLMGVSIKWDKACRGGDAKECLHLAEAFKNGLGDLEPDDRVALGYYQFACDKGSGEGCAAAAAMIYSWDGPAQSVRNLDKAQAYAERGCNALKNQEACANLGVILQETDPGRAQTLMAGACDAGDITGCRVQAQTLFYTKGDDASRRQALPLFVKGCDARQAWGCSGLADAYENGWGGVTPDSAQAADYARRGCTQGQGDLLTVCRQHGTYLVRTSDKASINTGEAYLNTACIAGDVEACFTIGRIGLRGKQGATTTRQEGLYYERHACDLEYGPGCVELGMAYENGTGIEADRPVAVALYDRACRLTFKNGCNRAQELERVESGVRQRISSIDPSLPAMTQIALGIQQVETGDKMLGVLTVYRLNNEGNEEAAWILGGWMYYGLPGVFDPPRKADGLILFDNAAKVGHVQAAIWMGMAYWYGDGVPEDHEKGENYMAIAASRGDKMAKAIYESMLNEPLRQEMAERQRRMEEAMIDRRSVWEKAFDAWDAALASGAYSAPSYSGPSYSGPSTTDIINESNWNQRFNYLSGATTACPTSNPYCH